MSFDDNQHDEHAGTEEQAYDEGLAPEDEGEQLSEEAERLLASLERIGNRMQDGDFEPSAKQAKSNLEGIRKMARDLDDELLGPLSQVLRGLSDPEVRDSLSDAVASVTLSVAGRLAAGGDASGAQRLLGRVRDVAVTQELKDQAAAAQEELEAFALLTHGRWLAGKAQFGPSQRAYKKALKALKAGARPDAPSSGAATSPAAAPTHRTGMRVFIEEAREAGSSVSSMPSLGTVNGIGAGFAGRRDAWPDGTYVTTHSFLLLFIPLFPFSAWRVYSEGDHYSVFRRVPLSGFARAWRWILPLSIVGLITFGVVADELSSPERWASNLVEEAHQAHEKGDDDKALELYAKLFNEAGLKGLNTSDLGFKAAMDDVIAILTKRIYEDEKLETLPSVRSALDRVSLLPLGLLKLNASGLDHLEVAIAEKVKLVEHLPLPAVENAADLVQQASTMGGINPDAQLVEARARLMGRIAEGLEATQPSRALGLFLEAKRVDRAQALLEKLPTSDVGLVVAERSNIDRFAALATTGDPARLAERLKVAVASAQKKVASPKRTKLLASEKTAEVKKALKRASSDQELAGRLAELLRQRGKADQALAALASATKAGWLLPAQEQMVAELHFELGNLDEAEGRLARIMARDLPAYRAASAAFTKRLETLEKSWLNKARIGSVPPDLDRLLSAAVGDQRNEVFWTYVNERIGEDAQVKLLSDQLSRMSGLVGVALQLGMVRLSQSRSLTGEARQAKLSSAEQAFLAVGAEAEGSPAYHLSLGEVFYRLGKQDKGEEQFNKILAMSNDQLTIELVGTYRGLGEERRARTLAQEVYDRASAPEIKHRAAHYLGLLAADLEERVAWYEKAAPETSPQVALVLAETKASLLQRDGKLAEADRELAKVVDGQIKMRSFNNAATAYEARYGVTGKLAYIERAVGLYKKARALEPSSAIIVGNVCQVLDSSRDLRAAGRLVDLEALMIDGAAGARFLGVMEFVPAAQAVRAKHKADPTLTELRQTCLQHVALAPTNTLSYPTLSSLFGEQKDVKALKQLVSQVQAVSFDTEGQKEAMERSLTDDAKDRARKSAAQTQKLYTAVAKDRRASKMTRAAAWLQVARSQESLAQTLGEAAPALEAAKALTEVKKLVPKADVDLSLANALITAAAFEVAGKRPELASSYTSIGRRLQTPFWLAEVAKDPKLADAVADIRASEHMKRALELRRGHPHPEGSTSSFLYGQFAGDKALMDLGRPAFDDEVNILQTMIAGQIWGSLEGTKAAVALFRKESTKMAALEKELTPR